MSVSALITEGVGPGSTIPLFLTEGLYQAQAPSGAVGGHYLPPKKRKTQEQRAREKGEADAELHEQLLDAAHPERIIERERLKQEALANIEREKHKLDINARVKANLERKRKLDLEDEQDVEMLLLLG